MQENTFTKFFSAASVFSNSYKCNFQYEGVDYNCSEQAYMALKSRFFGDEARASAIMATDDPKVMKRIGRQVASFDQAVWDKTSRQVMSRVCEAKFRSNPKLCEALLATSGTVLVECSPWDYRWGIRLGILDPRSNDHHDWLGANRLGFILSKIRDTLSREQGKQPPWDCSIGNCTVCQDEHFPVLATTTPKEPERPPNSPAPVRASTPSVTSAHNAAWLQDPDLHARSAIYQHLLDEAWRARHPDCTYTDCSEIG